jgi:hypothetical protein
MASTGFDGVRLTIPIRNRHGRLRGVLRYDPFGPRRPKMRAVTGTQLGLVPHPIREPSDQIVLVEGPPDMIATPPAPRNHLGGVEPVFHVAASVVSLRRDLTSMRAGGATVSQTV